MFMNRRKAVALEHSILGESLNLRKDSIENRMIEVQKKVSGVVACLYRRSEANPSARRVWLPYLHMPVMGQLTQCEVIGMLKRINIGFSVRK